MLLPVMQTGRLRVRVIIIGKPACFFHLSATAKFRLITTPVAAFKLLRPDINTLLSAGQHL